MCAIAIEPRQILREKSLPWMGFDLPLLVGILQVCLDLQPLRSIRQFLSFCKSGLEFHPNDTNTKRSNPIHPIDCQKPNTHIVENRPGIQIQASLAVCLHHHH